MDAEQGPKLSRAFERLGLDAGSGDQNLARIVRMCARSLACPFGAIVVPLDGEAVEVTRYRVCQELPPADRLLMTQRVAQTGEILIIRDAAAEQKWRAHPLFAGKFRSFAAGPIHAPDMSLMATLYVLGEQPLRERADVIAGSLVDGARLIEDALSLRGAAVHDSLTQLFNRRVFDERLEIEWRRAMRQQFPVSVALIDIDHFKQYNDAAGHAAGDTALVKVAQLLQEQIRRAGDVVCRYGGEEFAVLLPATDAEGARIKLEELRQAVLDAAIPHPGRKGEALSVSIGVATASSKEDLLFYSPQKCLGLADAALYEAKRAGRNRVQLHSGERSVVRTVRDRAAERGARYFERNSTTS